MRLLRPWKSKRKLSEADWPWGLSTPLFSFDKHDYLTIGGAVNGILIVGATGSGKSSGSGKTIAQSFLKAGFGGLVLCAKSDEARAWEQYCREAGRSDDLIIFSPEQPWRFNFLDFELQRKGRGAGLMENLRKLLTTVADITKPDSGDGGGQQDGRYWEDSKNQLLRNLMDLIIFAKGRITISDLYEVLASAPTSIEQTRSAEWQRDSFCYHCLSEAHKRPKTDEQEKDFRVVAKYWFYAFPALAEKTRGIVASTYTSMTDVMNRGMLRRLFSGETNLTPQAVEEGKIVVIDLPVHEFSEVGSYAAAIWKYCFQMSILRRDILVNPRPVFLWQDEAQHFVLSTDMIFQSTCRSLKVSNVVMTQNISSFYATMGNPKKSEALVDSLFGNLNTKIFHANGDHVTNEWMAKTIGRSRQLVSNSNNSHDATDPFSAAMGIGTSHNSAGVSEIFEFEVQPSVCTTLRTGGPANHWLVDSVIFSSGSRFKATDRPYLFCTFSQK
jgi:type IV secretory pathway TraG/TraD family ATPase VirD4